MKKTKRMTRIFAGTLAAVRMMATVTSLAASADESPVGAATSMNTRAAFGSEADEYIQQTSIKLGMIAIETYVPGGKLMTPLLKDMLGACGVIPKEVSMKEINRNITEMRAELNSKLSELEKELKNSSTTILNKIKNENYMSGFGTELNGLHTSVKNIADQIDAFNNDPSLTPEERAVEIAALIGNNTTWDDSGNLVFRIRNIASMLNGTGFADADERNMYEVVYDNCTSDVMFSGEAYDLASKYVDRVMYEYLYGFTVMAQCFDAANTVSQLSPEQVAGFSEKTKHRYLDAVSQKSVVDKMFGSISDEVFNADREGSVASAYSVFHYKKNNERSIYINEGNHIVLSKNVKETAFRYGSTSDSATAGKRYAQAKKDISAALKASALKGSDIKKIYVYAYDKYPELSFDDYLEYVGIDTSNFKGSLTKYFSKTDDVTEDIFTEEVITHYTLGLDTFSHSISQNEALSCYYKALEAGDFTMIFDLLPDYGISRKNSHDLYERVKAMPRGDGTFDTYKVFSLEEYNSLIALTFESGELPEAPATAAEILG